MSRLWNILLVTVLIILVVGGAITAYAYSLFQPVSTTPVSSEKFIIPKGQATSIIAQRLTDEGFIKHPLVFRVELKRQGLEGKIQAGTFELSPHMTPLEIAEELTTGTTDIWVTFLEGWRREEVAESLVRQQLENIDVDEFLALTTEDEGRLFPDTYLVPRQITSEQMASLLTNTFDRKITQGLADEIAASGRTLDEIVIMASILEREAKGYEEMRQVSGILWQRIEVGMALQVDASLQYAKGYNKAEQSWWVPPLGVDRQQDSVFNTYTRPGLPPAPISNPGLDAIRAAINPASTNYVYYLHGRDGQIRYAETLDQHNANIDRYLR